MFVVGETLGEEVGPRPEHLHCRVLLLVVRMQVMGYLDLALVEQDYQVRVVVV